MKHELHTQQFSGFTHHVSLQLGEVLGDSSSFKIDEQLSCAPLTCSDGSENFLLSPQKIVFILKTVITKWHFPFSSLPLVIVRGRGMAFGFLL